MITSQQDFERVNLLVVDDMESIRSVVTSSARELGFQHVFSAGDGEAAWRQIISTQVDMIVCDWDMPVLNGLELLRKIRCSERHKEMPFLMLTATADSNQVKQAIDSGVTDYLVKPFQSQQLKYRIVKMLRKLPVHLG